MRDTDIYGKTDAGRDEIRTRARRLPGAVRAILLMVDGQRTVGEFRDIIAGSKAPADTLETLLSQGLIEARTDQGPSLAEAPVHATAPAAPAAATLAAVEAKGPLPLPETSSSATLRDAAPLASAEAGAPAGASRHERLYAMMSEIVRDFLAPHRRYFIQLKIEKCSTPEELLELLHELRALLAKARGEAFAAEIVSRVRDAAS